jgi:transposase, IS30 family
VRNYEHLNIKEREQLFGWKKEGFSLREIAAKLLRNVSTISRELKRNSRYGRSYLPCVAEERARRIGTKQRYKAPLKEPAIFLYVREHLRPPFFWTPEMISMHIGFDIKGASIDPETIYRYIYSKAARRYKLWRFLPCGRAKRMKKLGRKVRNKGKIPGAVSIDVRPKTVLRRKQIGHWETDNVEGIRSSRPALSVTVERVTRFHLITKVSNQTAIVKSDALIERLRVFPTDLRRTITQDNGRENYAHENTRLALGTDMFFCHAYHSWEKGTVENRNRVIRRFFPKGTDFTYVPQEEVLVVENILNNMPMKCLGKRTPYEKMQQLVSKLNQFKP